MSLVSSRFDGQLSRQNRVTLADRVYLDIKQLLLSGTIPPGEKVTLRGLAQQIGTSPMPVRDAVKRLVIEGAFDMSPSRTLRVFKPGLGAFREIVKLRCTLEGLAAFEATPRICQADINIIEQCANDYERLAHLPEPDMPEIIAANRILHFTLYRAAQMPMLVNMIENLWTQIAPVFSLSMGRTGRPLDQWESFEHHTTLVRCLRAGDAEGVRGAIVSDIQDAAVYIEKTADLPQ